jgi:AbrB family looped-hinge helix DNA binding protein
MSATYATITSKGQITLPAEARRALGLRSGQKVAVRVEGDHLIIDRPQGVEALRDKLRAEAQERGTWGATPQAGEGWSARAEDHRGER